MKKLTQLQQENLNKLETLINWTNDLDPCLYQVQAQYVVALALLNYIESLGMFYAGYYKINPEKGKKERTNPKERFNKFFRQLGSEYENLINNGKDVYDELRCGFTHELIPKKYNFTVWHSDRENEWFKKNDEEKEVIRIKKSNIEGLNCGVIFNNGKWEIHVGKLLYDFNKAKEELISKIKQGDVDLLRKFDEVSQAINLKHFII